MQCIFEKWAINGPDWALSLFHTRVDSLLAGGRVCSCSCVRVCTCVCLWKIPVDRSTLGRIKIMSPHDTLFFRFSIACMFKFHERRWAWLTLRVWANAIIILKAMQLIDRWNRLLVRAQNLTTKITSTKNIVWICSSIDKSSQMRFDFRRLRNVSYIYLHTTTRERKRNRKNRMDHLKVK